MTAPRDDTTSVTAPLRVLRLEASGRLNGSRSRQLTDLLVHRLQEAHPGMLVMVRDLADGLPQVDEAWIRAKGTPPEDWTEGDRAAMALSDALVAELKAADVVVMGVPIYNFSMPAALKAWIDLVARPRVTFRYTPDGPVGLLPDRKVYVAVASGGTELGGPKDFLSDYLRFILGFMGLHDVTFVAADALSRDAEAKLQAAEDTIDALDLESLQPLPATG